MKKINNTTPDSTLVEAYLNGDERALSIIVDRHQQHLYNFIYSKVFDANITEDIFQDTFIKVVRNLKKGNYQEKGKFISWVMRIAHNLVIDYFRKRKRMPKFENREEFDIFSVLSNDDPDAEQQMMTEQDKIYLQRAMQELPEEQLEVLEMRVYKEMSFKAIALQTDVSINTALGRMRYALINLRKVIGEHKVMLAEQ